MKIELKVEKRNGYWYFTESKQLSPGDFNQVHSGNIASCHDLGDVQGEGQKVMVITTKRPHHRRSLMVVDAGYNVQINGKGVTLGASQDVLFWYFRDITSKVWVYIK
jgi:hypothetical protein